MLQDGIYYCIIPPWVLRGNRVIIMTLETENLLRIKSLWDPIRNMEGILDSVRRNRLSKISQYKSTAHCYLRYLQIMSGKKLLLKFKKNEQNLKFYRKATWMLRESICSFMKHLWGVRLAMAWFWFWCLVFPVPWGKMIKRKQKLWEGETGSASPNPCTRMKVYLFRPPMGKAFVSQGTELLNPKKTLSETALKDIQISKMAEIYAFLRLNIFFYKFNNLHYLENQFHVKMILKKKHDVKHSYSFLKKKLLEFSCFTMLC